MAGSTVRVLTPLPPQETPTLVRRDKIIPLPRIPTFQAPDGHTAMWWFPDVRFMRGILAFGGSECRLEDRERHLPSRRAMLLPDGLDYRRALDKLWQGLHDKIPAVGIFHAHKPNLSSPVVAGLHLFAPVDGTLKLRHPDIVAVAANRMRVTHESHGITVQGDMLLDLCIPRTLWTCEWPGLETSVELLDMVAWDAYFAAHPDAHTPAPRTIVLDTEDLDVYPVMGVRS